MGRVSSIVVSMSLWVVAVAPTLAADPPAPPAHTYAIPCAPSGLLRRHDALLALASQVRADLTAARDSGAPSDATTARRLDTTLFQIAVLERDTLAAHRALERVRASLDAPAQRALSGLFTEPYVEARVSPGTDFHATFRERMNRRLAALPFAEADFTLQSVRGQMLAATPDTMVGTARAALDPLVQDGRIASEVATTLIALAVNDELVRSVREDLLACLDATFAAHRNDTTPYAPRIGVLRPPARGAWFGQPAPGRTPVRVAPAILDSVNLWCNGIAFSPDGEECFLSVGGATYGSSRIVHARCVAGVWTPFAPLAELDGFIDTLEPHYSPDGNTLYFTGKRAGEFRRLWTLTRKGAAWSAPVLHPAPIVGEGDAYRGSRTTEGTWYFGLQLDGMVQIHRATPDGAAGYRFESLGAPIDQRTHDGDPCVAPDGRWLVFNSARDAAVGGADLYVSFPDGKGGWGAPLHLGPAYNTPVDEYGAMLSPDGRRLYFTRHTLAGDHLLMVDVAAIDALKPAGRK
jgi:hypothetical protein